MKVTRKLGLWLMIAGLLMQVLNILTYGLWNVDIDILGLGVFLIGLIIIILKWKKKK